MCINIRKIYNKYTGKALYVPCGHCPACLQDKASSRSNKIRFHHANSGKKCYFITLTYDNLHIPFINYDMLDYDTYSYTPQPLHFTTVLPICRLDMTDSGFCYERPLSKDSTDPLSHVHFDYFDFFDSNDNIIPYKFISNDNFEKTSFYQDPSCDYVTFTRRIGVLYKPDFVNFIKRLRINYERKFKSPNDFEYFVVGEYGPTTHRPHFHLLLWTNLSFNDVKSAVVKAWPFADKMRTEKYVEIARQPSDYVSSYVNSSTSLPALLQKKAIKIFHSHSKNFGFNRPDFKLPTILYKLSLSYQRGDIKKGCQYKFEFRKEVNGLMSSSLLLPKYVRNRYFPEFVGRCRLDDASLLIFLRQSAGSYKVVKPIFDQVEWDDLVFNNIVKFVRNKYLEWWKPLGYSPDDFAHYCLLMYRSVRTYNLYSFHFDEFLSDEVPLVECYDNIIDYLTGDISHSGLDDYIYRNNVCVVEPDPNKFQLNLMKHHRSMEKFTKYDKTRKINSFIYSL